MSFLFWPVDELEDGSAARDKSPFSTVGIVLIHQHRTISTNMDVSRPVEQGDLFSAKDLVVVITGGGSGQSTTHIREDGLLD